MPFSLTMPKLSPTMETGVIAKWHKKEGDEVKEGDLLLEISTDKATIEHHALDGGWMRQIIVKEGEEIEVNAPIAILTVDKDEPIKKVKPAPLEKKAKVEVSTPPPSTVSVPETPLEEPALKSAVQPVGRVLASPLARKLAKERGIDLSLLQGTGPGGRIMSRDLEGITAPSKMPLRPPHKPGSFEEEPLTPMRKVIAERLQESKMTIPHFYLHYVVDAEPLVTFRGQLKDLGIPVTLNDCLIRACALALKRHPKINSGFHAVNKTIIRFKTVDVAVAVSVPDGLITPIIRCADYKGLKEISEEIRSLARKAREGKLEPHEYKGGSFTLSNMGMFGVNNFQAIINPPQAAILAISAIQEQPVVKEGKIGVGKVCHLTLSVDHRIIDGTVAAEFMKTLKSFVENPLSLVV